MGEGQYGRPRLQHVDERASLVTSKGKSARREGERREDKGFCLDSQSIYVPTTILRFVVYSPWMVAEYLSRNCSDPAVGTELELRKANTEFLKAI